MITTCTVCQARYQLEDDKVPRRVIRVRCPACSGVFSLDGSKRAEAASAQAPERLQGLETGFSAPTPQAAQAAPASRPAAEPVRAAATPAPAPRAPAAPAARTAAPAARTVAVAEPEAPAGSAPRRRRSKEEMLARALVSDILVYNRDQRDAALRAGNLVEALGGEIKKSWELYKEKVGPEVANSTNHFREALNEILAEGEKVF